MRQNSIRKTKFSSVNYGLLILLLAGIVIPGEATLLLALALISIHILQTGKIVLGSKLNIWLFFVIWMLGIVMDVLSNNDYIIYVFIRYTFYIVSPVIYIYYGTLLSRTDTLHKFFKTFYIAAGINIIFFLFIYVYNLFRLGFEFEAVREARVVISIIVVLAIFIYLLYGRNHRLISRKVDIVIFLAGILSIVISLSRTFLLFLLLGLLIYMIAYSRKGGVTRILKLIFVPAVLVAVILATNEDLLRVMTDYMGMISRSIVEISTENTWTLQNISDNWRGFEVYNAQKRFLDANILQKLFGTGARGVYIGDVAYLVAQGTVGGYIPLLHNGFYAVLTYSGILGLILFIYFYLEKAYYSMKHFNKYRDGAAVLMLIVTLGTMAITYVMTGPISSEGFLHISIIIGFVMNYLFKVEKENSAQLTKVSADDGVK